MSSSEKVPFGDVGDPDLQLAFILEELKAVRERRSAPVSARAEASEKSKENKNSKTKEASKKPKAKQEERSPAERSRRQRALQQELRRLELRHPRHAPILTASAALALEEGARERAISLLDQATSVDPDFVPAALLRSRIAAADGNLALARRRLGECLLMRPDEPRLHEALSGIHHLAGDGDRARESLVMARELWGEGAPAGRCEYHLGLLAEKDGLTVEARMHYQASLDADSSNQRAVSRLRALGGR